MHVSNSRFSSKTFICAAAYGFLFRVEQRRFKICAIFNHLLYARAFLGKFKTLTTSFCVYFGTKQNWQFWNSGPSYTHLKTHARMLIIVFYKLFSRCAAQTKWNLFSTKIKKKKSTNVVVCGGDGNDLHFKAFRHFLHLSFKMTCSRSKDLLWLIVFLYGTVIFQVIQNKLMEPAIKTNSIKCYFYVCTWF